MKIDWELDICVKIILIFGDKLVFVMVLIVLRKMVEEGESFYLVKILKSNSYMDDILDLVYIV